MDRRTWLVGSLGVLAAPLAAEGQPTGKVYRVGLLNLRLPVFDPEKDRLDRAFAQGLDERGYVLGQNVVIVVRAAGGKEERLPETAAELVRLGVDVIVAATTPQTRAAKAVTSTIPIVMVTVADPVGSGLVASLARPGGNVTGLTNMTLELNGKRLQLLTELVPGLSRVAALLNPSHPAAARNWAEAEAAARPLGVTLHRVELRDPGGLPGAFAAVVREKAEALIVLPDPLVYGARAPIAALAAKHRLPAVYELKDYALDGGLMSYGTSLPDLYRRAAGYVARILKGAKPADLPVELPIKFELVINMKTAKALGLAIPPAVLARADEIIQ
jgi:ABC-type uncharacterized transport system substrate-binding protein